MDKHLEQEPQLNTDVPVSEDEYSLEAIMREFGSWTTPPGRSLTRRCSPGSRRSMRSASA